MEERDVPRKCVVFIDSFGRNGPDSSDLEHMPWLSENMETGDIDCSPVYVTPTVLGSMYTGKTPPNNGMPSVSRYNQTPRMRPGCLTMPEYTALSDAYQNVASLGLPFICPAEIEPNGNYWHHSEGMGQSSFQPGEAKDMMNMPAPAGDMAMAEEDDELDMIFNSSIDHCTTTFSTYRNLMLHWDLDVMFIGYRVTDSYVHYNHTEMFDDEKSYRQELLSQIDRELEYLSSQAELFVFGDHGGMEMDSVFRLNRWLIDNDYLEVDIDSEWIDKSIEYGVMNESGDGEGKTWAASTPGITVDEEQSVAISDDPFSTGITLLEGADEESVEELISDLEAELDIEEVIWTKGYWGDGDYIEECPDLYAVRKPGVFVSGNLHPEMGGAEVTRDGVHHPIGHMATNSDDVEMPDETIRPEDIFDLIMSDFLGMEIDDIETESGGFESVDVDEQGVREHLEDLGYI